MIHIAILVGLLILAIAFHTRPCTRPEIHDGFLSPGACRAAIQHARALGLEESTVADAARGQVRDTARTSSHVFLGDDDPVGTAIRDRVSRLTGTPVSRMEHVQILRYRPGDEYKPHFDACNNGCDGGRDMPRTETVLIYLNTVEAGGVPYRGRGRRGATGTRGPVAQYRRRR